MQLMKSGLAPHGGDVVGEKVIPGWVGMVVTGDAVGEEVRHVTLSLSVPVADRSVKCTASKFIERSCCAEKVARSH